MAVEIKHVPGKKKNCKVMIYALSTCGWCKKTKQMLKDGEVEYFYIDVDLVTGTEDKRKVVEEMKKWNPFKSFPTIVIDDKECIMGFDEEKLRKVIDK
ncbi:MAG: glutaredoxin family protein [Methanobacteriota archaeon]